MPYEINWEPSGVVFRFSGVVLDEDVMAANEEVYSSPQLPAMKYQIVDFSMIEKLDVSYELVRRVAELDRAAAETNPHVRVAIITSAPFVRGMSNVYAKSHEAKGGTWTTQIFEREEDARGWVVPEDH